MIDNPRKNSEGYKDPTAYDGLKTVICEENALCKEVGSLINVLKQEVVTVMSDKNKGGRPSIPVNPITVERLKKMRSIHRESQNEVGSIIGYKGSTYARYEKGERGIDYEDLKKLAVHWNTFVEYLTGEEDYSTEEEREEVGSLINVLKFIINKSGFELISRIEIKDKRTGRIFK